jgi:hypothetical protein
MFFYELHDIFYLYDRRFPCYHSTKQLLSYRSDQNYTYNDEMITAKNEC